MVEDWHSLQTNTSTSNKVNIRKIYFPQQKLETWTLKHDYITICACSGLRLN